MKLPSASIWESDGREDGPRCRRAPVQLRQDIRLLRKGVLTAQVQNEESEQLEHGLAWGSALEDDLLRSVAMEQVRLPQLAVGGGREGKLRPEGCAGSTGKRRRRRQAIYESKTAMRAEMGVSRERGRRLCALVTYPRVRRTTFQPQGGGEGCRSRT
ncbi:hypothetical protein BDV95DRAFT_164476 [Massariosphaeria phaeospora]|uniref:Uncharacterized protein n=1 Tax=Massariosphaeria phaeospora TaxID=100035 RepID=A0A7C8I107_9PLEO|nr:hypothetical protein BDV95DRAFT_164476 [Massariosphaeria phaeospora]